MRWVAACVTCFSTTPATARTTTQTSCRLGKLFWSPAVPPSRQYVAKATKYVVNIDFSGLIMQHSMPLPELRRFVTPSWRSWALYYSIFIFLATASLLAGHSASSWRPWLQWS